jgi:tetratricopeptide (TPR) repeat protein
MYKSRLRKWGLRKNLSENEARAIAQLKAQRDLVGKSTEILRNGRRVNLKQVSRHLEKKGLVRLLRQHCENGIFVLGSSDSRVHIRALTPPPDLRAPESIRIIEDVLKFYAIWIRGNFESGNWKTENVNDGYKAANVFDRLFYRGVQSWFCGDQREGFRLLQLAFVQLEAVVKSNAAYLLQLVVFGAISVRKTGTEWGQQLAKMLMEHTQQLLHFCFGLWHPLNRLWPSLSQLIASPQTWAQAMHLYLFQFEHFETLLGLEHFATIGAHQSYWETMSLVHNRNEMREEGSRQLLAKYESQKPSPGIERGAISVKRNLAGNLQDNGRLEEAREILLGIVEQCQDSLKYTCLLRLAQIERDLGNLQAAETFARECIEYEDSLPEDEHRIRSCDALLLLSDILKELGNEDAALEALEERERRRRIMEKKAGLNTMEDMMTEMHISEILARSLEAMSGKDVDDDLFSLQPYPRNGLYLSVWQYMIICRSKV